MATTESPMVVGIFRDRTLANQAIDELRHAGFRDDQIRLAGQAAPGGGLLDHLASALSGHEAAEGRLPAQPVNEGETLEEALKDGGTLRIVVREEQVRVEKYPVVKEEIFITKRQVLETRHISDTVKREEAHLERLGNVNIHGSEVDDGSREPEPEA